MTGTGFGGNVAHLHESCYSFNCLSTYFSDVKIMGVATTTDPTNNARTSFEILKNLYGISVQVNETTKKKKKEECTIFKKKS